MSAFLIVNGVRFPTPKRGFKITVLTNVDSGVNALGAVVGQVIGRNQYKLDSMQWEGLDAAVWERMLKALEPFFIPVTFEDPQTRERRTITMYPGSRSGEPYWLDRDKKIKQYRNCQLNLVDCGWE
ncbi:MAG: hypothetical protein HFI20_00080 [Lachnospiraceae bacterium]|nr:hypothetical protein [Lachnospiraceae bacterium]MCI9306347.1 hypothetical protein [Lachnospiraceae bacterium]